MARAGEQNRAGSCNRRFMVSELQHQLMLKFGKEISSQRQTFFFFLRLFPQIFLFFVVSFGNIYLLGCKFVLCGLERPDYVGVILCNVQVNWRIYFFDTFEEIDIFSYFFAFSLKVSLDFGSSRRWCF